MRSVGEFPVYAVLPASEIERAKDWYAEKLELHPEAEDTPFNAWYRCGEGSWFILTQTRNAGTAKNTAAGFSVKGIQDVMQELRSRGVIFEEYDFGEAGKTVDGVFTMGRYRAAWFTDSEGNIMELSEAT